MPKTKEILLFINSLKRAVDNTTSGAVLIDQYHRMYLLGFPLELLEFFAKGLTWKGGGLRWSRWVIRSSKAGNRKLQRGFRGKIHRLSPTIKKMPNKEL
jgi:hypothetical protein